MTPALLLAAALQASGAQAPAPPTPPGQATPLAGVTVDAPRGAPRLVGSYPAAGAVAPFGVLVLKLVFDQPMDAGSGEVIKGADAPACLPTWRLLADRKSMVLLCSASAGATYHLTLGADPARTFKSRQARAAEPFELTFTTEADKTDSNLPDALKSAGLKPDEGPVMDWRAPRPPG